MAPDGSKEDKYLLLNRWLQSKEVARYADQVIGREPCLVTLQQDCKDEFARHFYMPEYQNSSAAGSLSYLAWLTSLVFRVACSLIKKTLYDCIKAKSAVLIVLYFVGEFVCWTHLALKISLLVNPKHFNFRRRLATACCGSLAATIDSTNAIFHAGGSDIKRQIIFSLLFKLLISDIILYLNDTVKVVEEVRSAYPSGSRRYTPSKLLWHKRPNKEMLWNEVPDEYKVWAMEKFHDHVIRKSMEPEASKTIYRRYEQSLMRSLSRDI